MKTFQELRTEGQRLYKETAEAAAKKEQALQKIVDMKVYRDDYIKRARAETEQEISDLWASAGAAFQAITKTAVSEKRDALKQMLSTPPTTDQMNLLNTLQLDKSQPSQEEAETIAAALADNYRASHALQGILEKVGFTLRLAPTCDYAALTDALNQVEAYLKDRAHELKNFTTWRNAHPWFRLFFGEGWNDTVYSPNAELLDGNKQTTPTVEPAVDPADPAQTVGPDPAQLVERECGPDSTAHTGPKTIGRTIMPPTL